MKNAHAQGGWTISEVEHLIGLSRRDIQRCCYQGKGGMGILEPQDSSWGRRSYSTADIAMLFLVRFEKQSGMSLPEISKTFQAKRDAGTFDALNALDAYEARIEEQLESLSGCRLSAIALLKACREGDHSQDLGEIVEHELTLRIGEAAFERRHIAAEKQQVDDPSAERSEWLVRHLCELPAGWLTVPMSKARREDDAPSADALRNAARRIFARTIDDLHASGDFPTHSDARQAIVFALDAPGMDLAFELWLGPGASKHIKDSIQ